MPSGIPGSRRMASCDHCGKSFAFKSRGKDHKRNNHYCSDQCYRLGRWGGIRKITRPCAHCGKPVEREFNNANTRSTYGPFCNHICYGKWRSTNLNGENSPAWKGGYSLQYFGNWKSQRKAARSRDDHTCQQCGVTRQQWGYCLDVHHIINYNWFYDPHWANKLYNLITLCRSCHADAHKQEAKGIGIECILSDTLTREDLQDALATAM